MVRNTESEIAYEAPVIRHFMIAVFYYNLSHGLAMLLSFLLSREPYRVPYRCFTHLLSHESPRYSYLCFFT